SLPPLDTSSRVAPPPLPPQLPARVLGPEAPRVVSVLVDELLVEGARRPKPPLPQIVRILEFPPLDREAPGVRTLVPAVATVILRAAVVVARPVESSHTTS